MPFNDPVFLQNLGEVTISFALLDGALSAVMNMFGGMPGMKVIAGMQFERKTAQFIAGAASEVVKYHLSGQFNATYFRDLKAELNGVAAERNRIMHDYWTLEVETQRKVLHDLKGQKPKVYPTAESLKKLSDRIWEVRSRLAPLATVYLKARRSATAA